MTSIVGHKPQLEIIRRALESERLNGAYLFCGPEGIGKRTIASLMFKAMACLKSQAKDLSPCGICAGCLKHSSKSHPDQFFVSVEDDSTKIKIEQIRQLQASLQFHPLESGAKLALIDDADLMNESASNALLKTLEEPPPMTHIVLVSSRPMKLIATIRSRCQKIAFSPLSDEDTAKYLTSRGQSFESAAKAAVISGGSIGLALSMSPQLIESVTSRLGMLCLSASSADIISAAAEWAKESEDKVSLTLDIMTSFYRDLLRMMVMGIKSPLLSDLPPSVLTKTSPAHAEICLYELESAKRSIEGNSNKQLMFERVLFTLTARG